MVTKVGQEIGQAIDNHFGLGHAATSADDWEVRQFGKHAASGRWIVHFWSASADLARVAAEAALHWSFPAPEEMVRKTGKEWWRCGLFWLQPYQGQDLCAALQYGPPGSNRLQRVDEHLVRNCTPRRGGVRVRSLERRER